MKKLFNSFVLATTVAMISAICFAGCSGSTAFDALEINGSSDSRTIDENTKTISSDLNPGYGKAVFFSGDFNEGKDWTVAIRGEYEDGKWTCNVTSNNETFEYKALIGDWDAGETVEAEYTTLRKLGKANQLSGYQGMPSNTYYWDAADIKYGEAVYFKHHFNSFAVRGTYKDIYAQDYSPVIYNSWVCYLNGQYFYAFYGAEAYVGPYDLGEKIYPTFTTLTWEAGENHLYK